MAPSCSRGIDCQASIAWKAYRAVRAHPRCHSMPYTAHHCRLAIRSTSPVVCDASTKSCQGRSARYDFRRGAARSSSIPKHLGFNSKPAACEGTSGPTTVGWSAEFDQATAYPHLPSCASQREARMIRPVPYLPPLHYLAPLEPTQAYKFRDGSATDALGTTHDLLMWCKG